MKIAASFFAVATLIHGLVAEKLNIPEVEALASSAIHHYKGDWHAYLGATSAPPTPEESGIPKVPQTGNASATATSGYWLEDIKHQGVAAFGISGYKVFRNVKDYGAVGMFVSYS